MACNGTPRLGWWYTDCCYIDLDVVETDDELAAICTDPEMRVYPSLDTALHYFWVTLAADPDVHAQITQMYPDYRPFADPFV